jgi:hypothetical protein
MEVMKKGPRAGPMKTTTEPIVASMANGHEIPLPPGGRAIQPKPGSRRHWQQFIFCLILTLIWPLLPLGFEWLTTDKVKLDSITLAASMYAIGIGVSSRNIALFGVALLEGFIFCLFYGLAASKPEPPHYALFWKVSLVGMVLMFLCHAVERFNRHVILCEVFPDFMKAD